jgi:hypothetical protein
VADAILEGRSQIVHETVKNESPEMNEAMIAEKEAE